MEQTSQLEDEQLVNGVCLQFANMLRDEVKAEPDIAVGRWRIESNWTGHNASLEVSLAVTAFVLPVMS